MIIYSYLVIWRHKFKVLIPAHIARYTILCTFPRKTTNSKTRVKKIMKHSGVKTKFVLFSFFYERNKRFIIPELDRSKFLFLD